MIQRDDILPMEYLKKTEFTGCHQGMRYRLEGVTGGDGGKRLRCTWLFYTTPSPHDREEYPLAPFRCNKKEL